MLGDALKADGDVKVVAECVVCSMTMSPKWMKDRSA